MRFAAPPIVGRHDASVFPSPCSGAGGGFAALRLAGSSRVLRRGWGGAMLSGVELAGEVDAAEGEEGVEFGDFAEL